jgi:signal transduction histidine kinase
MLNGIFRRISQIGVDTGEEIYQQDRVKLTNQITTIFLLSLTTRLLVNYFKGDYKTAALTFSIALLFSFTFLLNRNHKHRYARLYLLGLLVIASYLIIIGIGKINYGSLIGFYFIELNSLVVFLLLFDRNYDNKKLFDTLFVIVFLNILLHDQVYFTIIDKGHQYIEFVKSDSYIYFKIPQLTITIVLFISLQLWKGNFRTYILELEGLNREVQEKNEEIMAQNEELTAQSDELFSKNEQLEKSHVEINYVNTNLETLVQQRTSLIEAQKEKLIEYAYYNAHKVRGPLARILGIINLLSVDHQTNPEVLLQYLRESATELDGIINEINNSLVTLSDEP